ncbi:hypothetical protein BDR05DRAFT_945657 [Suillus weaverae]|nr:hypothetical protein BDR05DRAFT_945657 [Suillus weaverae]
MRTYKTHLMGLRKMLNSTTVKDTINTTFDAWQAKNADDYFAVIGHWIAEKITMQWELKSALLGFTEVNNAHTSKHLDGALFIILDCVVSYTRTSGRSSEENGNMVLQPAGEIEIIATDLKYTTNDEFFGLKSSHADENVIILSSYKILNMTNDS